MLWTSKWKPQSSTTSASPLVHVKSISLGLRPFSICWTKAAKERSSQSRIRQIALLGPGDQVTGDLMEAIRAFFAEFASWENGFHRGDYKEFAHLIMYFVQLAPELKWTTKAGAIHHARWMASTKYVLKMLICGEDRI